MADTRRDPIREAILQSAEKLFYANGIRGVGIQDVRAAAGVSLKGLYGRFAAKDDLVVAYLETRHERWLASLRDATTTAEEGQRRVDAVFDWLATWFNEPDFNGCAFINASTEAASLPPAARAVVERHAQELVDLLGTVDPDRIDAEDLYLVVEGAITTARSRRAGAAAAERARVLAHALRTDPRGDEAAPSRD